MIDKARELLDLIRMRRDSLTLDGRDGQGVTPTAPEQSTTWIVTQVEPVLMAQPLTGGPAVSIQATDAIKGVKVANRIRVEVRGMGSRVAVALLDQLPITQRDKDERVASIAGKDITVGGSVSLSADDVGALPADTTLSDLGYVPPTMNVPAHSHQVTISQTVPINLQFDLNTIPRAYPGAPPDNWEWNYMNQLAGLVGDLRARWNDFATSYLNGNVQVNFNATTSSTSAGGGSYGGGPAPDPTNPGARSIVVDVAAPRWFEPGSPDVWSWSWGADVWTLIQATRDTLGYLSGRTLDVVGGTGSITLRTGYASIWTPPPWEYYTDSWGDQVWQMVANLYDGYNAIVGGYSVSGGGSVTIGSPITNPLQSVTPPGQYTQAFGAAVRLSLSRITSNLSGVCGASFPVN